MKTEPIFIVYCANIFMPRGTMVEAFALFNFSVLSLLCVILFNVYYNCLCVVYAFGYVTHIQFKMQIRSQLDN